MEGTVFYSNTSVAEGEGGTNFLLDLFEENSRDIPLPFSGKNMQIICTLYP